MLRVERESGKLVALTRTSLSNSQYGERSGLQELILGNPQAFFEDECKESLFVVKEEVEPSDLVGDRIDLLAIDTKGAAVIIELKRGSDKLQLLQSISYAAMISDWTSAQFEERVPQVRKDAFSQFLRANGIAELNKFQRLILVAERFDFEVLQTAKWLTYSYGMNVICYEIALAQESHNGAEYLAAIQLFPPREMAAQARKRGALKSEEGNKFEEIEDLLTSHTNPSTKAFFEKNLTIRRNRRRDSLVFPPLGKMRFRVRPKGNHARVSQLGRFEGDELFWKRVMSAPVVLSRGHDLRFRLHTDADVEAFLEFLGREGGSTKWTKSYAGEEYDNVAEVE